MECKWCKICKCFRASCLKSLTSRWNLGEVAHNFSRRGRRLVICRGDGVSPALASSIALGCNPKIKILSGSMLSMSNGFGGLRFPPESFPQDPWMTQLKQECQKQWMTIQSIHWVLTQGLLCYYFVLEFWMWFSPKHCHYFSLRASPPLTVQLPNKTNFGLSGVITAGASSPTFTFQGNKNNCMKSSCKHRNPRKNKMVEDCFHFLLPPTSQTTSQWGATGKALYLPWNTAPNCCGRRAETSVNSFGLKEFTWASGVTT